MTLKDSNSGRVCVSIVSHGHCDMLPLLLCQLSAKCKDVGHVILTFNLRSDLRIDVASYPFTVTILENAAPQGFGANHNQAFRLCQHPYFCVLNPDVQIREDPF